MHICNDWRSGGFDGRYTGFSLEEDEEDFSMDDQADRGQNRPADLQTTVECAQVASQLKTGVSLTEQDMTYTGEEVADDDEAVAESNEVDAAHKKALNEKLRAIPATYLLVQEQLRCTPSQKQRFNSDSCV